MRSKYKYVLKYICLVYIGLISAMLIFLSTVNNKLSELDVAVFLSAIALAILLAHYVYNIIKFLRMIKLQEKQYNITFDDTNLKSFAKWGLWVICSDNWLFSP